MCTEGDTLNACFKIEVADKIKKNFTLYSNFNMQCYRFSKLVL